MSQEYFVVCHECKKKVWVGSVGLSGLQFWSAENETMSSLRNLLNGCITHFNKLGFVWEQSREDEEYKEEADIAEKIIGESA